VEEYLSEAEQWERAKAWVRSYGPWIVGGVALAVFGMFGWNWYQERQDQFGLDASAKYEEMTQALSRNEIARAKAISAELEKDFKGSPYVDQAHLFDARIAVEAGDLAKADAVLRDVMTTSKDGQLALVARLRLARVQLAQGKPDDALATLDGAKAGAFEARFHEARGDVLFAKGNKEGALKEYEAAQAGTETRSVDAQSLQLKINDLKSEASAPAVEAAAVPAAPAAKKD
jgi:predicted negative regulator of RcsB-dependent stress response